MRGAIPRAQNLRFATVSRDRSTESTRGFIRQNQNARFATAACRPKFQNERFATAARAKMYMKRAHGVGGRPRHTKIIVLPEFRTSDHHECEEDQ